MVVICITRVGAWVLEGEKERISGCVSSSKCHVVNLGLPQLVVISLFVVLGTNIEKCHSNEYSPTSRPRRKGLVLASSATMLK